MGKTGTSKPPVIGFLKDNLCIGGTERSAANISKVIEKNYELYLILFDGSSIVYPYGGKMLDMKAGPKKTLIGKILNYYIRYLKIKKIVKHNGINVLYEFLPIENPLSYAKYNGVIKVISARDFGKMQRNTESFARALSCSGAMICNSEYIKNYYLSIYPNDKDKVFTVYNIIESEDIVRQSTEKVEAEYLNFIQNHSKNICVVGRFCKEKGFEYMIEAFAQSSKGNDIGLVMVGDGDYRESYNTAIERLGIKDKVYFTGFQNNPYRYMAKSDIFVLSSLSEGFPNVVAEAMSLGLPIIAANCYSGPAEILRDDCDYEAVTDKYIECDYGILTPRMTDSDNQNAITELSEAIVHLAKNDELMKKYSALSKQRARDFSSNVASDKFDKIFQTLGKGD